MRLVAALAWIGCNKDQPTPADSGPPVTLVTYNAGLAVGFVPGAESRTPLVAEALANVDADIVCLQEVWLADQIAAVQSATAASFPHSFFPAAQQSSDASCAAGEIDPVVQCLETNCADACADEVPDCLLNYCVGPFLGLSLDCQRCAQANVGEDPASVGDTCTNAPVEFAYGGSFGTGILSKYPMGPVEEKVFASTSNRRSVLHTTVDVDGAPLELYCTHLTAIFDTIPYPRESPVFGAPAWAAEQLVQIDEMNAWIDANGGDRIALLGDMNTGPAVGDIAGEYPENYDQLAAGWSVPYADQASPVCTYCGDNPLQLGSGDDGDSRLIDHVMLKGFAGPNTSSRVLDETVAAETCGTPIDPAALSDHYGVQVVATP